VVLAFGVSSLAFTIRHYQLLQLLSLVTFNLDPLGDFKLPKGGLCRFTYLE